MTITFSGWLSHTILLSPQIHIAVRNPKRISSLGLASFAFARHYLRNLVWFLFLALLRCFSSGGSPHTTMNSSYDTWALPHADCSIRTSTDQCLLTTPRSFSQLTTSFVGSQCQGIHSTLFYALPFASWSLSRSLMIFLLLQFFTRLDFSCRFFTYS